MRSILTVAPLCFLPFSKAGSRHLLWMNSRVFTSGRQVQGRTALLGLAVLCFLFKELALYLCVLFVLTLLKSASVVMTDAKNYFKNFLQDSTQENVLIIPTYSSLWLCPTQLLWVLSTMVGFIVRSLDKLTVNPLYSRPDLHLHPLITILHHADIAPQSHVQPPRRMTHTS